MMVPEPEPLECDRQQCNYLEYPLHRNELWGFFLLLLDMYETLLRAFVRHPLQSIYYNVHVVTRIIYRRASKQI